MIAELGHFSLVIALGIAIVLGTVPLVGAWRGDVALSRSAIPAAAAQALFLLIAFVALSVSFLEQDFSLVYVARNSNLSLPWEYRLSAVWGAHEGSLLLWALILSLWTLAVAMFSRSLPLELRARVLAVLGLVSIGFLGFMLFTSNPFERLVPPPLDGQDLNPLLQDPGLIVHPPMLYMGYVGLSVPFAFAVAALLGGRIDAAWTRWTRPWTTLAWVFLTLGITLGSWWAYYELGWGGWWFWDPVENASFMPWLIATALMHSLAVTEQRGAFRAWTLLLAICGFSLSLLGTFLVRSGVLVSVHAFATDPERGSYILAFLAVTIGAALTLFALRAHRLTSGGRFALLSRETLLLVNNVALVVAGATVLLGTLYPLIVDALGMGKISVGPPYFNSVFIPLTLPLALIIGVAPLTRWKQDRAGSLLRRLVPAIAVAIVASVLLVLAGIRGVVALGALTFAVWVASSTLYGVFVRLRHRRAAASAVRTLTPAFVGMTLAHLGAAAFIAGVTVTSLSSSERDVALSPGNSVELDGYQFRLDAVANHQGPNYRALRATVTVSRDGKSVATLHPEKRRYAEPSQPMTEAGIHPRLSRDLYVSLGDRVGDDVWAMRVHHKPMVRWIWLGGLQMAIGGLIAVGDRRYRRQRARDPSADATQPDAALPARVAP